MASYLADGSCSEYIDEINKLHNSNNQLKKTNDQLYQELESLRTKYREVSEKNKKIENEKDEIDKLKEKITNLENEKNELLDQVKKTQSLVDDLKDSQIQENENTTLNNSNEQTNSNINNNTNKNEQFYNNSNTQNINYENQLQINQLTDDNKELTRNLNEQIKRNEQLKQKNKIVIETFSNYFQKKFQNISQLINFVKKEGKNPPKKPQQSAQQNKQKKTTTKGNDNLNSNNNNAKILAQKLNLEMELKNIENDVIKFKHDAEINDLKNKQEIETKNKKIDTLENENSFLKQQIMEMNSAINSIPSTFHLSKNSDKDDKLTALQQTLSETAKQLQNAQNENKDISRQLSNAKADNEELYNKIENKNQDIINLRIERDDFEGKYNAAYAQVEIEKANNQKLSTSLNDISKKYRMSQDSITNFAKLFDSQREEISKLTNDRNSLSSLIFKVKDFIQKEEEVYDKLISENKSYKKNLKSIKNTINKIKNQSTTDSKPDNNIPITSWYCLEFDEDLCRKISEVASNEGISDTSKLKYVFQIIAKHYKNMIEDMTNENKKELDKHTTQNTTTTDFIATIAKQIGVKEYEGDLTQNPMKICEFQQNLSMLINECESLRKSYKYHTNLLDNISQKLNSKYDEIPNRIDSTNMLVADLQKDMNSSLSKQKTDKQEYRKKLEQLNSKNAKVNEQKDSQIAKLKAQNARLSSQVKALNKMVKANTINESQNQIDRIENDSSIAIGSSISSDTITKAIATDINTNDINNNTTVNNNIQTRNINTENNTFCNSQISTEELTDQINLIKDKDKEIQRLEDEVNFWKQNLELVKTLQNKKEADNQKTKDNQDELLMATRKRFQTEKDEIIRQYELVISNIKKQNLELKKLIETMSASNSKNEEKISKLKDINTQLNKENSQLSSQLTFQRDELKRQNSINSQKLKACQLANESSSKNQIADLQLQFYSEKRKLLSYAIHLFHNYYNNEKKIDEDVFKETLTKASDELQKLSKQDKAIRELLGITNNESVETNLSSVLMKLYKQE